MAASETKLKVLEALQVPHTRGELVEILGIPGRTLGNTLQRFRKAGLIIRLEGRRWKLSSSGSKYLKQVQDLSERAERNWTFEEGFRRSDIEVSLRWMQTAAEKHMESGAVNAFEIETFVTRLKWLQSHLLDLSVEELGEAHQRLEEQYGPLTSEPAPIDRVRQLREKIAQQEKALERLERSKGELRRWEEALDIHRSATGMSTEEAMDWLRKGKELEGKVDSLVRAIQIGEETSGILKKKVRRWQQLDGKYRDATSASMRELVERLAKLPDFGHIAVLVDKLRYTEALARTRLRGH